MVYQGAASAASTPGGFSSVAFATLKPTLQDASSQLVDNMRGTLRRAREINDVLSEAEATVARARAVGATVDAATSDAELRAAGSEIEKIANFLTTGVRPTDKSANPPYLSPPMPTLVLSQSTPDSPISTPLGSMTSNFGFPSTTASALAPAAAPGPGGGELAMAALMAQEIETTAVWVQQIMETVRLVESDAKHERGASLLPVLQTQMRQHDTAALRATLALDVRRGTKALASPPPAATPTAVVTPPAVASEANAGGTGAGPFVPPAASLVES